MKTNTQTRPSRRARPSFRRAAFVLAAALAVLPAAQAQTVEATGDVSPFPSPNPLATWNTGGYLIVGDFSPGSLTIANGGSVSNTDGFIGCHMDSGSVTVTGAGSTWTNTGNLILGGYSLTDESATTGTSTLTVTDGGSVWVGGTLRIFNDDTVTLDGGTIRFDGYNRDAAGTFTYTSGTVRLAGNRTIGADSAISDLFGAVPVIGADKHLLVEGNATLNTTLTLAAGGALTVGGDFTQDATSTLRIELGDVNHDAIDVTGHLTLGGTLQIVAGDDFDPVSGDSFQLFTFGNIGGAFDQIDAFTLGAGLAWDFSRLETEGWISVTAVPEPAAFAALASLGALGLAATRRRRRA